MFTAETLRTQRTSDQSNPWLFFLCGLCASAATNYQIMDVATGALAKPASASFGPLRLPGRSVCARSKGPNFLKTRIHKELRRKVFGPQRTARIGTKLERNDAFRLEECSPGRFAIFLELIQFVVKRFE